MTINKEQFERLGKSTLSLQLEALTKAGYFVKLWKDSSDGEQDKPYRAHLEDEYSVDQGIYIGSSFDEALKSMFVAAKLRETRKSNEALSKY